MISKSKVWLLRTGVEIMLPSVICGVSTAAAVKEARLFSFAPEFPEHSPFGRQLGLITR